MSKRSRSSDQTNDPEYSRYFKKLSRKEQRELGEIEHQLTDYNLKITPIRYQILTINMPIDKKAHVMSLYTQFNSMEPNNSEYFHYKRRLDGILAIPWGIIKSLPVTLDDGYDNIKTFLDDSRNHLNKTTYAHKTAKEKILGKIAQILVNPEHQSMVLGIKGPPGCGKTTIIHDGIAKILDRPFFTVNLGGARDTCMLKGSNPVWDKSTWGKIVQILISAKCMNPIIYFDELCKISGSVHGKEISDALCNLIDPKLNHSFHDDYLGISIDVSKVLFIFSYNNEDNVDRVLLDRMDIIGCDGYSIDDKIQILDNYMLPILLDKIHLHKDDIKITDNIVKHIIKKYANKEEGVRELNRCVDTILTKINLLRLSDPKSFEKHFAEMSHPRLQSKTKKKNKKTNGSSSGMELTIKMVDEFLS